MIQQSSGSGREELRGDGDELEEKEELKNWGGKRRAMSGAARCLGRIPLSESRTDLRLLT